MGNKEQKWAKCDWKKKWYKSDWIIGLYFRLYFNLQKMHEFTNDLKNSEPQWLSLYNIWKEKKTY